MEKQNSMRIVIVQLFDVIRIDIKWKCDSNDNNLQDENVILTFPILILPDLVWTLA